MELKFCSHCCMDGTDPLITFDSNGVCNHCINAQRELALAEQEKPNLSKWIERIKQDANTYDCLIGLSGGCDSSTLLHEAVKLGLKPLCYSIDNGYNDPKADENIMRMVETLKVPFFRYTIDLHKFKQLQSAFIKAGLVNLEIPTDHILMASALEMASKYKIKWILSGGNVSTESVMPASWSYNARDLTHIQGVYKWAFNKKLKGLPLCGLLKWNWYKWVKGIKTFYLLDYLDYNLTEAKDMLAKEYGWQDYHEKHCESLFTWWFQNFYLFEKFGIDKRKAHYSSLINSGQLSRDKAMSLLSERPVYPELHIESKVMKYKKHRHEDFPTDKWYGRISKFVNLWK